MTESTCKRQSCDEVSPLIAGHQSFCSTECRTIHDITFGGPIPGDFTWLVGRHPARPGERTGGWPT